MTERKDHERRAHFGAAAPCSYVVVQALSFSRQRRFSAIGLAWASVDSPTTGATSIDATRAELHAELGEKRCRELEAFGMASFAQALLQQLPRGAAVALHLGGR